MECTLGAGAGRRGKLLGITAPEVLSMAIKYLTLAPPLLVIIEITAISSLKYTSFSLIIDYGGSCLIYFPNMSIQCLHFFSFLVVVPIKEAIPGRCDRIG
jgi:hypothetical protein